MRRRGRPRAAGTSSFRITHPGTGRPAVLRLPIGEFGPDWRPDVQSMVDYGTHQPTWELAPEGHTYHRTVLRTYAIVMTDTANGSGYA
jgi:hypothetical protein